MTDRINILLCGNSGVRDGMLLSVISLAHTTAAPIRLFIGTMELTDVDPCYTPLTEGDRALAEMILKEKNEDSEAVLVDMGEAFRRELYGCKNMQTRYTPYAMLRLCADLYPLPGKLIYIDTDVIALRDLSSLWQIDVEDCEVAGALDYYGRWFISPRYMNSGVMLWNMDEIRRTGVFLRARKMCRERKMLLCDQTAINRCARKKRVLPRRFNEQHKARENTVVQHFSMRIRWIPFGTEKIKPWQPQLLHEKLGIYYLDEIIARWERIKERGYEYCK